MKTIREFWKYLSHIGVKPEYDLLKRTKIILTNKFAIISLSFPLVFAFGFYQSMPNNLAWFYQLFYVLFPIALWLNAKGFHRSASMYMILIAFISEFLLCSTFGYESGEHFNYISIFFAGFIIIDWRKPVDLLYIFVPPVFFITLLFYTDFSLLLDTTLPAELLKDNYLASFINTIIMASVFGYINLKIIQNQGNELEQTQLRLRELIARDEKEKNRLIIENALDAVLSVDTEGRIIEWNKQAELIFGWTKQEVEEKKMENIIIPPRYRGFHKEGIKQFLASGILKVLNRRIEISGMRKIGEVFPIELSIVKIKSEGQITFCAFIRDLSEKKKAEMEIQLREKMISETNKVLGELRLNALKAQINPHFYFNTLNNLYGLALIKSERTPETILMLSSIMEYIIYDCNADYVPLHKEIEFIRNYVAIEKLRYFNDADIVFKLDGNVENLQIAPMILIQFVENAFKHGLQKVHSGGFIYIQVEIKENIFRFQIVNKKQELGTHELKKEAGSGGIGIQNAKNRLYLLYYDKYKINIEEFEDRFKVDLDMDLH